MTIPYSASNKRCLQEYQAAAAANYPGINFDGALKELLNAFCNFVRHGLQIDYLYKRLVIF
jgi:hypothetical protein